MRTIKLASQQDLVSSKICHVGIIFLFPPRWYSGQSLSFTTDKLTTNSHSWSLVQLQQQTDEMSV